MPASEAQPLPTVAYPAGIGRRMGAALYDALLIVALWMLTLLIWVVASGGDAVSGLPVQMVLLGEYVGFYLLSWQRRGQTLGMAAWRIRLVNEAGAPPSLRQMIVRLLSAPLSVLSLGLGYLWFYVGTTRQTWHDRLSNTMIVHIPKPK